MKARIKQPLFRKVNTRARGVRHDFGGDFRNDRRSSKPESGKMARGVQRGLDYTPLFKFLLSRVGKKWDDIYGEAVKRLDKPDPIWWMVSLNKGEAEDYFRCGESSYYSGLYVDEKGILQIVNSEIHAGNLKPSCPCCTHTFNGKPFSKKYED